MIRPTVAALTTTVLTAGLLALGGSPGQAAELSFVTPEGLFLIESGGRDRTPLLPTAESSVNGLAWSPSGQQLAVVQNYGQVYRVTSPTHTPELVFSSQCSRSPSLELTWQPTGDTLVIAERCPAAAAGDPPQWALFLSQGDGALTPITTLPTTLDSAPYLSPDGQRVAYVHNQHLFVAELDGSRSQRLTQTPGTYGAAGSPLAWSPDGTRLAFYEGNYPFQRLNVIGVDGSDRRVLTPEPNAQIYRSRLFWSPDGRYIAFYRPHNPPLSNQEVIALVNVNTGEIQTVTRPGFYDAVSWAPDSQQLVLASGVQAGQQTLFLLDLVSQEFTPLNPQPLQNVLDSQWAPDGSWIAFTGSPLDDALGTQVLHWVKADGSQFNAVTTPEEYVYPFTWVPAASPPSAPGLGQTP
ncbi:MAG TPA: DPP IV N-terminal domain-containing protein [Nodosilinea sp.]|nr:DPP IV N-terminal domain-containing protein [Nodosilinea sp.]